MTDWGYPPSRPLPADGIKARTKRGSIGQQWWSRRFIDVLESFGLTGRLSRGRSYARAGQVLDLHVGPGTVTAPVQGSRPVPYRVRIGVQALYRAALLAGEMPPEIEEVFAGCGVPLFPASLIDLDMSCSCPDWGMPCKHLAATCYLLAEAFDEDPFLVLAWRGRDREQLLARLRQLADPASAPAAAQPVIEVADRPLADCLDDYWSPGASLARLRAQPASPATTPDLLLRSLAPPPVTIRRRGLADLLGPAYRRLAIGDSEGTGG
jgi:uncharacterized Zn finger protein